MCQCWPDQNSPIQGSDTFLALAKKLAETYISQNPEVKISVKGGGAE